MLGALGVNVRVLYTLVFALGAALAALAGVMAGPIFTVESGMGESVLILAFVVIVIGGIGLIRGAFIAALLVGLVDAMGRAYLARCSACSCRVPRRRMPARRSPRCRFIC
jgi:branched-chain amino acid transport system permease protein